MRAQEFVEADLGTKPRRSARAGSRPPRGHEPVPRYRHVGYCDACDRTEDQCICDQSKLNELAPNDPNDSGDDDDGSMQAEFTVVVKGRPVTGTVVLYPGESTDVEYYLNDRVYRKTDMQQVDDYDDFIENAAGYIQEITQLKGDGHHFVEPGQLNELMFMGLSPCKTDCSGHRAGYKWSKDRGGVSTASWSDSFNRGAEIAKAGY